MKKLLFLFIIVFLALPGFFVHATGNTTGYAWATMAGWINFSCNECSVNVTDTAITGYAWSQNYGWINFSPAQGGVTNTSGALSGSAWGENTGWINFDLATINSARQFTGTASGDVTGTIVFTDCGDNCGVVTIWTPATGGTPSVGSYVPVISVSPIAATVEIIIDNGAAKTNSRIATINFSSVPNATLVQISSSQNFEGAVPEVYKPIKSFILPPGDGVKTIYVRFLDNIGNIIHTVSSTIILDTQPPDIKINEIKKSYEADKDIIISGTVNKVSEIVFYFDNQYGMVSSNKRGNWTANLGKFFPGKHHIYLSATDELGNKKTIGIDIIVSSPEALSPDKLSIFDTNDFFSLMPPLIDGLKQRVEPLFNFLFPERLGGQKIITIPKNPPLVMQGKWNLLPAEVLKQ